MERQRDSPTREGNQMKVIVNQTHALVGEPMRYLL